MTPSSISKVYHFLVIVVLIVTVCLTPVGVSATVQAPTDPIPSPILDPNSVGWASVRNMTSSQFADYFEEKSRAGMMVMDIEVDEIDGEQRVGATWQMNTDKRGWAELRNMTEEEFIIEQDEKRIAGFRMIDQEVYTLGSQKYYAAVWIYNTEDLGWISYTDKNSDEFSTLYGRYREAGYLMIDVDAGYIQGEMNYSAVWVENSESLDWVEWRDMTSDEFAEKFDEYEDVYRMIDVESYKVGGEQYYAGIWVENINGRGWYEYRDMSAKGFGDKWLELRDAGYRLVDYEVYPYGDGYRYAGIWRQNSERPNWPLKSTVDALGLVEMILSGVPGMSIAIAQNGSIVYLKGFGYADVDDEIIAHSGTLFRLASVSKAVGGVLSLELQEEELVDISDPSSDHIPGLPDHHTHTIQQTMANRSGIGHYDTYPDIEGSFGTALAATFLLWDTPLVANPGSMYIYSTHAYTFLGASLEGAVGDPIGTIFEDYLRTAYNLGTLNLEDRSQPNKFRSLLYDTDNDEVEADDLSWKVLGGGLESSAYDLLRFGMLLLNGTILDQDSLDLMWTPPDNLSNYALGWNTGTHKGSSVVAKDGAQLGARSYLRIYPDDGIVIAILTNRKEGGHDPAELAKTIGGLMLDAAAAQSAAEIALQPLAEVIEEPTEEGQDPAEVIWPVSNPTATPSPEDLQEPPGEIYIAEAIFLPFVTKP